MYKKDLAPKDITRLKEAVLVINKLTGNEICADCQASRSLWASVNFGVFLCSECAGIHRGLGVHISQVRSVTLDDWTPSQVFAALINGNLFVNYHLLKNHRGKPLMNGDGAGRNRFIQDKYDACRFGSRESLFVVNRDTFPDLTVNAVLEFYSHALAQYRKNVDQVTVRYELIRLAGYQNMGRIVREPSGIHLRVPELTMQKPSFSIVNKKPILLAQTQSAVQHTTVDQQGKVHQQVVKEENNLVDLDFGEMTCAPPVNVQVPKGDPIGFGQPVTKELESKIDDLFFGLNMNNGNPQTFSGLTDLFNGTQKIVNNDDWPTLPSALPSKTNVHGMGNGNNTIFGDDLFSSNNGTSVKNVQNTQSIIGTDLFATETKPSMATSNHSVFGDDLFGPITSANSGTTSKIGGEIDLFATLGNATTTIAPTVNNGNSLISNDLFMNSTPLPLDNASPVLNSQPFPAFSHPKPVGPEKVAEDRDFILSLFKN
uniref:Arf-GAP domain-containing protein n=1 Tax=Panagrolaimus sp. JU765 TaxID=591449 RepID=A0AC34QWA9_9BILA